MLERERESVCMCVRLRACARTCACNLKRSEYNAVWDWSLQGCRNQTLKLVYNREFYINRDLVAREKLLLMYMCFALESNGRMSATIKCVWEWIHTVVSNPVKWPNFTTEWNRVPKGSTHIKVHFGITHFEFSLGPVDSASNGNEYHVGTGGKGRPVSTADNSTVLCKPTF
jgi:hypothetical protein